LLAEVHVGTLRELEDLVIESIYAELIAGKLDQRRQHLTIDFAVGRDLRVGDLDHMITLFDDWTDNCERLLTQVCGCLLCVWKERCTNNFELFPYFHAARASAVHMNPITQY
jgi:hypothetical protein